MISNPLLDARITNEHAEGWKPPIRELMRDGVWLVPPEDRPRGWEKMIEIQEMGNAVQLTPVRQRTEPPIVETTEVQSRSEVLEAEVEEKQPERSWGNLQEILGALDEDESHLVPIPTGEEVAKFRNRLRSIISMWKSTAAFRWTLRREGDAFRAIKLERWPDPFDRIEAEAVTEEEAEIVESTASKGGNHTDPAIREQAEKLLKTGLGVRMVMKQLGLAKNTVLRIRSVLGELPPCECGKAGGHRGWCKPRLAKSPARQETMRKLHENQRLEPATNTATSVSYLAVIADLEAKRATIDAAIIALRALI